MAWVEKKGNRFRVGWRTVEVGCEEANESPRH
jgi:hypothetical protein